MKELGGVLGPMCTPWLDRLNPKERLSLPPPLWVDASHAAGFRPPRRRTSATCHVRPGPQSQPWLLWVLHCLRFDSVQQGSRHFSSCFLCETNVFDLGLTVFLSACAGCLESGWPPFQRHLHFWPKGLRWSSPSTLLTNRVGSTITPPPLRPSRPARNFGLQPGHVYKDQILKGP